MNLIELVLVIVIVGVLAGAVMLHVIGGIDGWNPVQIREGIFAEGRRAMDRLDREIGWGIGGDRNVLAATASALQFIPTPPASYPDVTFSKAAGSSDVRRWVTAGGSPTGSTLIANVSDFSLTYYGMAGNLLAAPIVGTGQDTDIWAIDLTLTLQVPFGSPNAKTMTFKQMIYPRNFLRENK